MYDKIICEQPIKRTCNMRENMKNDIFRKKSIDKISSPEDLNTYLHVARAEGWIVLLAVIIILGGLIWWSYFASIHSYVYGVAVAKEGVITATFEKSSSAQNIKENMNLEIGELSTSIGYVNHDQAGNIVAIANLEIPDGTYDAKVSYKQTQMITLLFN
jgi:hypothetical protein